MSETVRTINCTSCGAPLDLNGGHRVRGIACAWCGAAMDVHADLEVIARFDKADRPETPFEIGMTGVIRGVSFTIIGLVRYVMEEDGETWDWTSYQLFSPTHGYCWLTWNDGHLVFSDRVRERPDPPVIERFIRKRKIRALGRTFRLFESYEARILYVEGELTWIARKGDVAHAVEAIDPPFAFAYETGADEIEYTRSVYLDRDAVAASFGIDSLPPASGVHPAQPWQPSRLGQALHRTGLFFLPLAIVAALFTLFIGGNRILDERLDDPSNGRPLSFEVTNPDQLMRLEMTAPVDNDWIYLEAEITPEDGDEPVLLLGREISYYHGRDADGSWSEGSHTGTVQFKLPAGRYSMEIEPETEGTGPMPPLQVRLYDTVLASRWFFALAILSLIALVAEPARRRQFERRRWDEGDD